MKCSDIHLRDPFVLVENGIFYMYGSRAKDFAIRSGGFDVYTSTDLVNWSDPIECFDSAKFGLNRAANWAPEVHKYNGKYYMLATFTRENDLRATFILRSDSPLGPFVPHSKGPVTPEAWECLDGTLYIGQDQKPYLVFCHEHTQIIDGTICYVRLKDDLTGAAGEPCTMFSASSPPWADEFREGVHYVTDGPFLYRTKNHTLLMIWSTFIKGQYAECLVKFTDGELGMQFCHMPPLIADDGGHGMIFHDGNKLYLTLHSPNTLGAERPVFMELEDTGDTILLK
jgi:GH43 family beta-xylosidase